MGSGFKKLFKKEESSTEEEIKQLVEGDEQVGELEKNQRVMINNIFEFDDLDAGDIMTHRLDIHAVDCEATIEEAVSEAMQNGNSRIPVYRDNLDNIVGILYIKDLLKFIGVEISPNEKLMDYVREPVFVPESMPCGKLFAKMTDTRILMAIVVDEYGGTCGLITMEDVIESIVGNIRDEYDEDEEETVTKIDEKTFTFDGSADIDEVSEVLGEDLPQGDYDTVAGFVINLLGYLPSSEDAKKSSVKYNNFTFTVLEVHDRRIEKIKVTVD